MNLTISISDSGRVGVAKQSITNLLLSLLRSSIR